MTRMTGCASNVLRVAGLMSGTSADGVDVALVDISATPRWDKAGLAGGRLRVVAFDTFPYPPALRRGVLELASAVTADVDAICRLNVRLGEVFADAVVRLCRRERLKLDSLDLIGSHGQTIRHLPPRGRRCGSTWQIAEPAVIAQRTGITTIADFRPADMAVGGQGAPLVPMSDVFLLAHARRARVLQNIGGIANLTYLPTGCRPENLAGVLAFDTGPGNMIIDALVAQLTRGRRHFDANGEMASGGAVNAELLGELMRHRFLRRRPPKSTGREEFGQAFASQLLKRARSRRIRPTDLVATVTAFTAHSIADAYRRFLPRMPQEVILCGGGARNATLVAMLKQALAPAGVAPMDELGLNADAKEAVSFAVLAWLTAHGRPGNVVVCTGARRPVILGKICPGR